MLLITGSTGELGTEVINALLTKIKPDKIAVLVRDTDKAEHWKEAGIDVRKGDYFYPDALKLLMVGVKKLLLISASGFELRTTQHINVINVAKQMGVKHIYYTSVQRKDDSDCELSGITQSDKETESYLKSSGVTYTILYNTLYADSIPFFIGEKVTKAGVAFPAGKGKVAFVTKQDLGEAIATMLVDDNHENKEYILTNSESWSFDDIAEILSGTTGKEIAFKPSQVNTYVKKMEANGSTQSEAKFAAECAAAISEGEYEKTDPMLENLLGRKPTSLKEFLKTVYK